MFAGPKKLREYEWKQIRDKGKMLILAHLKTAC